MSPVLSPARLRAAGLSPRRSWHSSRSPRIAARAQENLPGFPKVTINDQTGAPLFFDMDQDGVDELLHANAAHSVDIWIAGGAAFPAFPRRPGGIPGTWRPRWAI